MTRKGAGGGSGERALHAGPSKNDKKRIARRHSVARRMIVIVMLALTTFYGHKYMQSVYYAHCRSNVFVAVLFNRSIVCMQLNAVLTAIEHVWGQAFDGALRSFSFWGGPHHAPTLAGAPAVAMRIQRDNNNNAKSPIAFLRGLFPAVVRTATS